jgi:hypothetical protein
LDAGGDLTTADNASDVIVSEPLGSDADASDALGEDSPVMDVVAEDVPLADGCATPDMCGSVPTAWQAALFWTGAGSATPPSCPVDTQTVDLKAGLTPGGPDTCGCTCNLSDTCSTKLTFHPDGLCTATCFVADGGMATISVTPQPDACTPVPANLCGGAASMDTPLTRLTYDAGCIANPATTTGSPSSWMTVARLCPRPVATGVCRANEQCLPGLTSDFSKICIYQGGDVSCPVAPSPYTNKTLLYSGQNDSRGCTACSCGNPSMGSCTGSIAVYGNQNCQAPSSIYSFLLNPCQPYNAVPTPGSVLTNYAVTHGACPTPATPTPTGAVTPTGPTTVCCM